MDEHGRPPGVAITGIELDTWQLFLLALKALIALVLAIVVLAILIGVPAALVWSLVG